MSGEESAGITNETVPEEPEATVIETEVEKLVIEISDPQNLVDDANVEDEKEEVSVIEDKIENVTANETKPEVVLTKNDIDRRSIRYSETVNEIKLDNHRNKSALFDHILPSHVSDHIESFSRSHFDDKDTIFRSNDSFFVQENPEGEELLNNLFEKIVTHKSDDRSLYSFSDYVHEKESEEITDPAINKALILQKINDANDERKELLADNHMYQVKLLEHFRMVKVKQAPGTKQSSEKESLMDFNTQYSRYGEILYGLMNELSVAEVKYNEKITKLKSICTSKSAQVDQSTNDFLKYQENVGLLSIHSRTGNKLDPSIINDYLQSEMKKEITIKNVRLNNLKIEHKNSHLDQSLRSKEDFEGGLRLIDFEQLKIENQTFNEKVEDREESINKLNKKITRCNHLLSHIKEKINVTDYERKTSRIISKKIDRDFKDLQKISSKAKKSRDHIKLHNKHLQMSCGLLGKKDYLRRFEDTSEDTNLLRDRISKMEFEKSSIAYQNNKLIHDISQIKNKKK